MSKRKKVMLVVGSKKNVTLMQYKYLISLTKNQPNLNQDHDLSNHISLTNASTCLNLPKP